MILDTSVLLAAIDRRDAHHPEASALVRDVRGATVPEAVLVETDWILRTHVGVDAEIAFLKGLADSDLEVEGSTDDDRARITELLEQYREARIGYVDAAVVAIAERLREITIATFDRRDFSLIRPRHVAVFELLP